MNSFANGEGATMTRTDRPIQSVATILASDHTRATAATHNLAVRASNGDERPICAVMHRD